MERGRIFHRFFYLPLLFGEEVGAADNGAGYSFSAKRAEHVIISYGIREFINDIDEGRSFRGEGGIIGEALRWASGIGFAEIFSEDVLKYRSARDFKERNLIEALKNQS